MIHVTAAPRQWLMAVLVAVFTCACALPPTEPTPTPTGGPVDEGPMGRSEWAEAAKDMVWNHIAQGEPPPFPLVRAEECEDGFAIVFFAVPSDATGRPPDGALLWAAGALSEPPDGADGGWVDAPDDPALDPYRDAHGPCEISSE